MSNVIVVNFCSGEIVEEPNDIVWITSLEYKKFRDDLRQEIRDMKQQRNFNLLKTPSPFTTTAQY